MEGGLTFERKYGGWLDICEEVWKVVGLLKGSMEGGLTFERKYGDLRGSMEGGWTFERQYGRLMDF